MDPDYIAFRELLRQAEHDPVLAAELTRLMAEARPLREILSLASVAVAPATGSLGFREDFRLFLIELLVRQRAVVQETLEIPKRFVLIGHCHADGLC